MSNYSCPICFEGFDNQEHIPQVLLCGHTICYTCLTNLPHALQGMQCPLDRVWDSRNLDQIPQNITITNIINSKHDLLFCTSHQDQKAEFLCTTCQQNYCAKCIVQNHRAHDVTEIDYERIKLMKQVEQHQQSNALDLLQAEQNLLQLQRASEHIVNLRNTAEADFDAVIQRVMDTFQRIRDDAIQNVQTMYSQKLEAINSKSEQFQGILENLTQKQEKLDNIPELSTQQIKSELDSLPHIEIQKEDLGKWAADQQTFNTEIIDKFVQDIKYLLQHPKWVVSSVKKVKHENRDDGRMKCDTCGRFFGYRAHESHVVACARRAANPRAVYNSAAARRVA